MSGVLPPLAEGDRARAEGAAAGAEVHAAAAAVLRSDARQGARGERHRPAEHLRLDHRRAAGSRLRQQASKAGSSRRALGRMIIGPADQELRRHHRRRVHAEPRGRSRQDRAGQDRLRRRRSTEFYKKFKKDLARAGKEMQDLKKGIEIGEACDKCGSPMLKQGRQVRALHRLQRVSRVHEHPRARDRASPSRRTARKRSSRARTAASRWS